GAPGADARAASCDRRGPERTTSSGARLRGGGLGLLRSRLLRLLSRVHADVWSLLDAARADRGATSSAGVLRTARQANVRTTSARTVARAAPGPEPRGTSST